MAERARPRLSMVFAVGALVVAILVAGLATVTLEGWRRSILESGAALRDETARRVGDHVEDELSVARDVLDDVERDIRLSSIPLDDRTALEAALFSAVANHERLAEVTLTRADLLGYDADEMPRLGPGASQLSVYRTDDGRVITRRVSLVGAAFAAEERPRTLEAPGLLDVPFEPRGPADDPGNHDTFKYTASRKYAGRVLASDLHWAEMDQDLDPAKRRIVVTVQKAIESPAGHFVGVLRVGTWTRALDAIVAADMQPDVRVFLCDEQGRLLTRLAPQDPVTLLSDDLRYVPASLPADLAAALHAPGLATLDPSHPDLAGQVSVDGRLILYTFHALPGTQRWNVGMVVPEAHYTGSLVRVRNLVALGAGALLVALFAVGFVGVRALRRGIGDIVRRTGKMRSFDFDAEPVEATYQDVNEALDSLERAKTVVRALGKYLPLELVRELYESNKDPVLGGELRVLSMMFTDIEGFTTLSERLTPKKLAEALGRYLESMSTAVESTGGTIDKYVGDAVMALWNAPTLCEDHALRACRAALACMKSNDALFASDAWKGLPKLHTRFGLHTGEAMIGHFGAPNRLSYTALGDQVNLAARLEGLCKQYGVTAMASRAVVDAAKEEFEFRLLDVVAVKGKTKGVEVYELLGERGKCAVEKEIVAKYEEAFAAYRKQDFAGAIAVLEGIPAAKDAPSEVLRKRCAALREEPPGEGWEGVFVAKVK